MLSSTGGAGVVRLPANPRPLLSRKWEPIAGAERLTCMTRIALLLTMGMLAAACAGPDSLDGNGSETTTTSGAVDNGGAVALDETGVELTPATVEVETSEPEPEDSGPSAEVLAAAILQLITKDHTFGQGPPPFTEYLVQSRLDPFAGNPTGSDLQDTRELTTAERTAIEAAVSPFGRVRWIGDPADWRTDDLRPIVEGGVILGVGEPSLGEDTGLVPVSLWCGGLCGTWLTYRLDLTDGVWAVTGIEGPIAIS